MSTQTPRIPSFENSWLDLRYPFDVEARHSGIEAHFLSLLPHKKVVSLVDIGSGIGANCRYFMDIIPCDQQWLLVERDPALSATSSTYLQLCAEKKGWKSRSTDNQLFLESADKKIEVRFLSEDILSWNPEYGQFDAITANALFDIFTESQLREFLEAYASLEIPLLATLNYVGMHIASRHTDSSQIIDWYEDHMHLEHPTGKRLGKHCSLYLQQALSEKGRKYFIGESNWLIPSEKQAMQHALLGFMEEAIPELPLRKEELLQFQNWLTLQKSESISSQREMMVFHQDILAFP